MDVFDVCAQIRADAGPKGKKCPGGYSIPANKQCGGKRVSTPGGGAAVRNLAGGLALAGITGVAAVKGRQIADRVAERTGKEWRKNRDRQRQATSNSAPTPRADAGPRGKKCPGRYRT